MFKTNQGLSIREYIVSIFSPYSSYLHRHGRWAACCDIGHPSRFLSWHCWPVTTSASPVAACCTILFICLFAYLFVVAVFLGFTSWFMSIQDHVYRSDGEGLSKLNFTHLAGLRFGLWTHVCAHRLDFVNKDHTAQLLSTEHDLWGVFPVVVWGLYCHFLLCGCLCDPGHGFQNFCWKSHVVDEKQGKAMWFGNNYKTYWALTVWSTVFMLYFNELI